MPRRLRVTYQFLVDGAPCADPLNPAGAGGDRSLVATPDAPEQPFDGGRRAAGGAGGVRVRGPLRRHPGPHLLPRGEGVVIVAGVDARTGRNRGLAITRVRTEDGRELPASEYLTSMGGYLTHRA